MKFYIMCQCKYILIFLKLFLIKTIYSIEWDNIYDFNNDYRLLWTLDEKQENITFEVQVKTAGYFGLGFSNDGYLAGADVVIGWVNDGQTHFQDRHVKRNSDNEPVVDSSQDYTLLLGYENATHTVMRFKRKLDTCDMSYDVPITSDTMRVIFMYNDAEPMHGSITPGSLPDPQASYKGYRSMFLMQKPPVDLRIDNNINNNNNNAAAAIMEIKTIELRNQDVELPQYDESLHWCKMFKLQDFNKKQHVIKYEPVFDTSFSISYIQHIILYECQGATPELELKSREQGSICERSGTPPMLCNSIVATWAKGSKGFTFPSEAGYALDSNNARFYLMETHYNNILNMNVDYNAINNRQQKADSSGLKLYYTNKLRKFDAGVLSIGVDPSWRHLIPPYQKNVVSEGHCVEECTKKGFQKPISIFAVMMRTHMIGKKIKLRHVREHQEFEPIAVDNNLDSNYQEYRRLSMTKRILPGDRLISECTYDSSKRDQITLGGPTIREESCIILTYYYPRQKLLTTCHSLPSLPTVLHSLGIQELVAGSNPLLIASPIELAGTTLESRLIGYDWKHQFDSFQQVTRRGSFKVICWDAKNIVIPDTEYIEGHNPNITKVWRPPPNNNNQCINSRSSNNKINDGSSIINNSGGGGGGGNGNDENAGIDHNADQHHHQHNINQEDESNNIIEGAARSKVSRSSATETLQLSGTTGLWKLSFVKPLLFVSICMCMVKLIL